MTNALAHIFRLLSLTALVLVLGQSLAYAYIPYRSLRMYWGKIYLKADQEKDGDYGIRIKSQVKFNVLAWEVRDDPKTGNDDILFTLWLYDEEGKVVYDGSKSQERGTGYVRYSTSADKNYVVDIYVPESELKLAVGQHKLKAVIKASNTDRSFYFNRYANSKIDYDHPKLYRMQEQSISLSSISSKASKQNGASGIQFDLVVDFAFGGRHLLRPPSIDANSFDRSFYLAFDLEDKVGFSYLDPFLAHGNSIHSHLIKLEADDQKNHSFSVFIPYFRLPLPPGPIDLYPRMAVISAYQYGRPKEWSRSKEAYTFQMKERKNCAYTLISGSVSRMEGWDVQSGKIPIVNVFSSFTKGKGKGYPDPCWKLSSGNRSTKKTDHINNDSSIPSATLTMVLADGDVAKAMVYDDDNTSRDDYIGHYELEQCAVGETKTFSTEGVGELNPGNFEVRAYDTPAFKNLSLSYEHNTKYKGLSGTRIDLNGEMWNTQTPSDVEIQGLGMGTALIRTDMHRDDWGGGKAQFFLPYYSLAENMTSAKPIFTLTLPSGEEAKACYEMEEVNVPELNEVAMSALPPEEAQIGGVWGYRLAVQYQGPDTAVFTSGYLDKEKPLNFYWTVAGQTTKEKEPLGKSRHAYSFVPFYQLKSDSSLPASSLDVKVAGFKRSIGKIDLPGQTLKARPLSTIELNIKRLKIKKKHLPYWAKGEVQILVKLGDSTIAKTKSFTFSDEKWQELDLATDQSFRAYPKDHLSLVLSQVSPGAYSNAYATLTIKEVPLSALHDGSLERFKPAHKALKRLEIAAKLSE